VRILDNCSTGRRSNLQAFARDVEIVEGDVRSAETSSQAVAGCDGVFHLAALPSVPRSIQDPLTSNASNVIGTLNVLLASRDAGVRRVVHASSSSIYGANPQLPKREDLAPAPISPYGVAKLAAEGYCSSFAEVYGLETVALRYFNVFGPRQDPRSAYAAVIPNFIKAILDGTPPIVYGDGEQSRDFTYVANVVAANLLAMTVAHPEHRVYNIACGESISLNALLGELGDLTGNDVQPIYDEARPGDVRHSRADIGRARADLGYEPSVQLREGLAATVEHYRGELSPPLGSLEQA
jgi:UDP-N-acetylglucosamine/UDP-N-acetyl-alpha-D-glucosaminouronate 4-epimerase